MQSASADPGDEALGTRSGVAYAAILLQDNEGYTFPDAHTAKGEAVKYAAELLSDVGESFWDPRDFEMTVTDEKGLILFTIRMIGT